MYCEAANTLYWESEEASGVCYRAVREHSITIVIISIVQKVCQVSIYRSSHVEV